MAIGVRGILSDRPPTVTDDEARAIGGLAVGSHWIDIVGRNWYVLLDQTDGAAVWGVITGRASSATTITAGNGLTGGGDLSADRTLNIVALDGTMEIFPDGIQVREVPAAQVTGLADIATSGDGADLTDDSVAYSKLPNMTADRLLGRGNGGAGDPQEITLGTNLSMASNTLNASGGGSTPTGTGFRHVVAGVEDAAAKLVDTADVNNDQITYAKIQNVTTDRLLGRDTAGSGDVEELSVTGGVEFTGSTGIQRSALTGDVTASAGSGATTIAAGVVTYAKIQNVSATDKVLGRFSGGAGSVEEISCTAAGRAILDDADASAQRTTLGLAAIAATGSGADLTADSVAFSKLPNVAADRLLGRGNGGGAGDLEAIVLGTNLSMTGTTINAAGGATPTGTGFRHVTAGVEDGAAKLVDTADINAAQVTFAKLQNIATDRLIGRDTAATGDPEELTVTGGLEFTGSGGIQRSALTGDVTATAGSNATTIANDVVSYAKLQNIANDRILGRDTAGAGDAEELAVSGGLEFTGAPGIQRSALTGDVTATAGSNATTIAANAVDNTKAADMATARIKGRVTGGSGDPEDLTGTQATTLLDVATSVLKGLVPASGGGTTNFLRADLTFQPPPGGGGGLTMTSTEVSLCSVPQESGSFAIAGAGMTVGKPVLVQQLPGPYTGKGTIGDDPSMDTVCVSAIVESATVIRAYWTAPTGAVIGNFKFAYAVSA